MVRRVHSSSARSNCADSQEHSKEVLKFSGCIASLTAIDLPMPRLHSIGGDFPSPCQKENVLRRGSVLRRESCPERAFSEFCTT